MDVIPDPPEVIFIDDDDDIPLPPPVKQTLEYLSKIEHDSILPSSSRLAPLTVTDLVSSCVEHYFSTRI